MRCWWAACVDSGKVRLDNRGLNCSRHDTRQTVRLAVHTIAKSGCCHLERLSLVHVFVSLNLEHSHNSYTRCIALCRYVPQESAVLESVLVKMLVRTPKCSRCCSKWLSVRASQNYDWGLLSCMVLVCCSCNVGATPCCSALVKLLVSCCVWSSQMKISSSFPLPQTHLQYSSRSYLYHFQQHFERWGNLSCFWRMWALWKALKSRVLAQMLSYSRHFTLKQTESPELRHQRHHQLHISTCTRLFLCSSKKADSEAKDAAAGMHGIHIFCNLWFSWCK